MKFDDLVAHLEHTDGWDWKFDPEKPSEAIEIRNNRFGTVTRATFDAIGENSLAVILNACIRGKDVDHITRVTGYFSRVSGWNKGKTGELKDRYRSTIV